MKKNFFTKILVFLLSFVILLGAFIGCSKKGTKNDSGKNKENMYDISSYTLIRPDATSSNVIKVTSVLKNEIKKHTNADLTVAIDVDAPASKNGEILIGNTDRSESKDALDLLKSKASKEAFIIKETNGKIAIVGLSDDDTVLGVRHFINEYVETSKTENGITIDAGTVVMDKTGKVLYYNENYNAIVLQRESDVALPKVWEEECFNYAKILKLEHSGKNNGILLATNQYSKSKPWPIYRSTDDGKTWEKITDIYENVNIGYTPGYQPYLFELPEDLGKYKKGTIVFGACSYNRVYTKLPVFTSTDLGETWKPVGNVAEGEAYNSGDWSSEGVWEPVFAYENGKLYCFYSDELSKDHNQRLVYRYTTDLKSWSKTYEASALGELRPGMVALTKMGNGKWALAYEVVHANKHDPKASNAAIYIKYADTLESWDVDDIGTRVLDNKGRGLNSAPAIAWTPNGGECGTLFVTACGNVGGSSSRKCDIFISFDYGKTFVTVTNPIPVTWNSKVKSSYSPGFYVDKNGDLYYVNDPEYAKDASCEKLVFNKIRIF